jgi:hypothetical protein
MGASECSHSSNVNFDGRFRMPSSNFCAAHPDPLLPHGCADCSLESSQSRNSCDGVVRRYSFDATQQPIALRSSVYVKRPLLTQTTKRYWPCAASNETDTLATCPCPDPNAAFIPAFLLQGQQAAPAVHDWWLERPCL